MKRAFLKLSLAAMFLAPALAPASFGCGLQGEGQLCDKNNGNDDCETGLTCITKAELGRTPDPSEAGRNPGFCCPATNKPYDCQPHGNTGAASSSSGSGAASSSGAGGGASSSSSSGGQDAGAG